MRAGKAARRGLAVLAGAWLAAAGAVAGAAAPSAAHAAADGLRAAATRESAGGPAAETMRAACPKPRPGHEQCLALVRAQPRVNAAMAAGRAAAPLGLTPADIQSAYQLPSQRNPHQTVAVVDAFDTPKLAQYLTAYRKEFGLPPCTVAAGCLRKVNQAGKPAPLPKSGVLSGWDVETVLDTDMISAACPLCKIVVVEARSPAVSDLAAAAAAAARAGAQVISNSYGGVENGFAMSYARDYRHPGHVYVAASGDAGFVGASFPASLATVTAVGGTQLTRADNARGWTEAVWNADGVASGSGCSAYVPKPSWQDDRHCGMRTVADVSAAAANIPVYDKDWGGWLTAAGTSAAAPIIAAVYALAGNAATVTPGYPYQHAQDFNDITAGNNDPNDFFYNSNGAICGFDYLCMAKQGYDAPTGLGTPLGTGAF